MNASGNSPYQPPKSTVTAESESYDITPAKRWVRLCTYLLDLLFQIVILGVISYAVEAFPAGTRLFAIYLSLPDAFGGLIMFLLYYVPLEAIYGRTLGKLIMGTKVISEDGSKPKLGQILGRTLIRVIPFEPFSFFRARGTGWHDSWSSTITTKAR